MRKRVYEPASISTDHPARLADFRDRFAREHIGAFVQIVTGVAAHPMPDVYKRQTNNRMELMAAISALEALKRPCRVDIHTDSQYLRNGIMTWIANWKRNGWRTSDCLLYTSRCV